MILYFYQNIFYWNLLAHLLSSIYLYIFRTKMWDSTQLSKNDDFTVFHKIWSEFLDFIYQPLPAKWLKNCLIRSEPSLQYYIIITLPYISIVIVKINIDVVRIYFLKKCGQVTNKILHFVQLAGWDYVTSLTCQQRTSLSILVSTSALTTTPHLQHHSHQGLHHFKFISSSKINN